MDLSTLIGIGAAFVAIFGTQIIEGGDPMSIILIPPLILVFGGTIGAGMAGGIMRDTTGLIGQLKRAFISKPISAEDLVESVVSLAQRARREGLLALEDAAKEITHPFLRRGLELAIDGTDPEELGEILHAEVDAKRKADRLGAKIFNDMGGYGPTVGIIGTVIGLVHVLQELSDPGKLGPLIAGAFVATLWGVMSANLIWFPVYHRLRRVSDLECDQMLLAVEGILAIQAGANPRLVAQRLKSLLPPESGKAKDAKGADKGEKADKTDKAKAA
jgi:chemotaxis protein MotA